MYIINSNWLLRVEYFGGILFDKKNNEQYQLTLPNAALLYLLKDGNNLKEAKIAVEEYFKTQIDDQDVEDFINNSVIAKTSNKANNLDMHGKLEELMGSVKKLEQNQCLSAPIEVSLYPTSVCNLKCKFCYFESKSCHYKKNTDVAMWKKLVDELKRMGVIYVSLLGGEPTLYSEIDTLLMYLENNQFRTTITTNGYSVREETLKIICTSEYITPSVSIQSLNKDTTKYLNGGNVDKVLEFIDKLICYGKVPKLNTVVTIQTFEELTDILDYANQKGIYDVSFNAYMELTTFGLPVRTFVDYRHLDERLKEYVSSKGYNINVQMQGCMLYTAYPELENPIECEYDKFIYGCEAGKTKLEIMPNGDVYPCAAFQIGEFKYENAFEKSITDIWMNAKYLKQLRNRKIKDTKCIQCKFVDFCNGGCPANNLLKNNSIETRSDERCCMQI